MIDLLKYAEEWICDRVFGKELPIPRVAEFKTDCTGELVNRLPGIETVVILVATETYDGLRPRELRRQVEAEEEAAGFEDSRDLSDGCGIVGNVLKHAEADDYMKGEIVIRKAKQMSEGCHWYLEAVQNWSLLAER